MKEKELTAIKTWRKLRERRYNELANNETGKKLAHVEFFDHLERADWKTLVGFVFQACVMQVVWDWEEDMLAKLDSKVKAEAFDFSDLSNLN